VREVGAQRAALALGRVAGLRARRQLLLLVRHDCRLAPRALARRLQLALCACRAGFIRAFAHSAIKARTARGRQVSLMRQDHGCALSRAPGRHVCAQNDDLEVLRATCVLE